MPEVSPMGIIRGQDVGWHPLRGLEYWNRMGPVVSLISFAQRTGYLLWCLRHPALLHGESFQWMAAGCGADVRNSPPARFQCDPL